MRNILIWGGAGFIGSVLVGKMLNKGYIITVADNLYKGGDALLQYVPNKNFHFKKADISKEEEVKKIHEDIYDGIIILSGIVGVPSCNKTPSLAQAVNVDGWKYVGRHKGDTKIVAASTGSVYGIVKDQLCNEETPVNPQSLYGITKLKGEEFILATPNSVALRFATCAGVSPNMRLNLLPNYMTNEAITNRFLSIFEGNNMRTFIEIRDFADSLVYALENLDNLKHQVYNVGTEENNWTKKQLAEHIKERTGCHVSYAETYKDEDVRDYGCDYSRMHEAGFKVKFSIPDMIDDLIKSVSLLDPKPKYT
jgi:nucleoside-diphosphate-sugar epimerase